jgi:hypothetical protein
MANLTSFQTDIRPLFTDRDIHAMSKAFNLGSYDDVKSPLPRSMTAFGGSVVRSCHLRHREEKVPGPNPGLSSSPDGCQTDTNLRKGSQYAGSAGSDR